MEIAFVLAMVLLFVVLCVISFVLFRRSRRAWWIWGGICLVGFVLLWRPISDFMDPWFLSSIEVSASEVISGREFTVSGWAHMERHIVLAGTRLPNTEEEQDAAKIELLKLLGEKKRITISFPQTVRRLPEPWPAIVISGGIPINEFMLRSGFLLSDGTTLGRTSATEMLEGKGNVAKKDALPDQSALRKHPREAKEPSKTSNPTPSETVSAGELPTWVRYVLWILAGFFGATSLGMVMNKRPLGMTFLLLIGGLAIRSIVLSSQSGVTVWPPIICLIITILCAGGARVANKEFLEKYHSFRK